MLLRMYNDASMEKTPPRSVSKAAGTAKRSNSRQSTPESSEHDHDGANGGKEADNNDEEASSPSPTASEEAPTSSMYASELEELIQSEQASRVALLNQVASLREQVR